MPVYFHTGEIIVQQRSENTIVGAVKIIQVKTTKWLIEVQYFPRSIKIKPFLICIWINFGFEVTVTAW